jgi:hypothetical protein
MSRTFPVSIRKANAADPATALGVTGLLTKRSLRLSKMFGPHALQPNASGLGWKRTTSLLYDNSGQDEERPARLFGNLVCRAGIQPPER